MKSNAHLHQKKLWIVEDDLASYELIASVFQGLYQTAHFQDGESCIKNLSNERPDIVLLDLKLPGESGFDVLRIFKAVDQTNKIPIVVVSAIADAESIEKALSEGAASFVTKPFNVNDLIDSVQSSELFQYKQ